MKKTEPTRKDLKWLFTVLVLFASLVISALLSLRIGEIDLGIWEIMDMLLGKGEGLEETIVRKIRLPRLMLGIAVGGSLSLSGVILQGIYRNPLVEPYTLGISGGAALGVAIAIVSGLSRQADGLPLPLAGFLGSLLAVALVYALSSRGGKIHIESMLLIGVMISFIVSSAMMLLMSITSTENLRGIVFWIMGSLDESNTNLTTTIFWLSICGLALSYAFTRELNALRLGTTKAKNLGVNTERTLRILFITASLLTGASVAVAGVIGFVGLIVPHLARLAVGTDHRILLVTSFLGGGVFLTLCDLIARSLVPLGELPVGVITGIIGGTLFTIVLGRKNLRQV